MEQQVNAVQRMQDYINQHLYENITLTKLSDISLYSPWHSYRLFIQFLNITPADYIRRLRLSKSALLLRDENIKILEVALNCGFNSVDGFQRAFFREFGCNPHEYVKSPVPLYLFTPFGVKASKMRKEITTMETIKNVFVQLIEKPERKVIIKRGISADNYYDYCNEVGCEVWGLLVSMKSLCNEPVSLWLPQKYIKKGTSKYVQGVEVSTDYNGEIPNGFDIITLPKAKYLMFTGEPFEEENYEQAIEQVWTSIKKFNPENIGLAWDNENPRIQLEPLGNRGYIELVAVK